MISFRPSFATTRWNFISVLMTRANARSRICSQPFGERSRGGGEKLRPQWRAGSAADHPPAIRKFLRRFGVIIPAIARPNSLHRLQKAGFRRDFGRGSIVL